MMATACERVAAENLPAVMWLDANGTALFATSEANRLCERWNSGLDEVGDAPLQTGDFRLPGAIADMLKSIGHGVGHVLDRRRRPLAGGLRLRHPSMPTLAVTVELGGSASDMQTPCYLLVFAADEDVEAASALRSPEGHKALERLTPSERKVALLVVEGLRNGEVAERLQRSRRTIEYQLNAIYRKLDVACRTQLVCAVA